MPGFPLVIHYENSSHIALHPYTFAKMTGGRSAESSAATDCSYRLGNVQSHDKSRTVKREAPAEKRFGTNLIEMSASCAPMENA
jgi:hypothetical protein